MTQTFKFTANGKPVSVALDNEETPLLNILRNELGLMGTRIRDLPLTRERIMASLLKE